MEATQRRASAPVDGPPTLIDELFQDATPFDFFQAVRLLARQANAQHKLLGADGPPHAEIVRLGALPSLAFPASAIHALEAPAARKADSPAVPPAEPPRMTITFLGLIGPNGVLPRHYTSMLLQDPKDPGIQTLRAWLDLLTHRWASYFYRAWEKYRFFIPFERGEHDRREPDKFTQCLYSLVGLGFRSLRKRVQVSVRGEERPLAQVNDAALLRYSGLLAHRPRCAASLELFLRSFLGLPVSVHQFQGQWLQLEPTSQSVVGKQAANNCLGANAMVGDRIWDVSKIRVRLGPLDYEQFEELLPNAAPTQRQKKLYLLAQLVRLFVGPEHDVEFQLVLRKDEVPATRMGGSADSRLGWNTWSRRQPMRNDADDPVFQADERIEVPPAGAA